MGGEVSKGAWKVHSCSWCASLLHIYCTLMWPRVRAVLTWSRYKHEKWLWIFQEFLRNSIDTGHDIISIHLVPRHYWYQTLTWMRVTSAGSTSSDVMWWIPTRVHSVSVSAVIEAGGLHSVWEFLSLLDNLLWMIKRIPYGPSWKFSCTIRQRQKVTIIFDLLLMQVDSTSSCDDRWCVNTGLTECFWAEKLE